MNIAFIGLGTMGRPMATRLCSEHRVSGWDVSAEACAAFAGATAEIAEALNGAEAVLTMLPEGKDVAKV